MLDKHVAAGVRYCWHPPYPGIRNRRIAPNPGSQKVHFGASG